MSAGRIMVRVARFAKEEAATACMVELREQSRLARRRGNVVMFAEDDGAWSVALLLSLIDSGAIASGGRALERFAAFVRHADAAAPVGALEDELVAMLPGFTVENEWLNKALLEGARKPSNWNGSAGMRDFLIEGEPHWRSYFPRDSEYSFPAGPPGEEAGEEPAS